MACKLAARKATIVAFAFLAMAFAAILPQFAFADDPMEVVVLDDAGKATIYDAVSAKTGKITVTVNAISDVDGYDYQIAPNKNFGNGLKEATKSASTTTFSGLTQGKTYYARARGYLIYEGVKYCTKWSSATKVKVAIKASKTKIVGTWKLVKSTNATENKAIKHNKKYFPKKKYTLTFKKNGVMVEKDYYGKNKGTLKWAATAKNVGYFVVNNIKVGSIKVSGKKIVVDNTEAKWTLERVK